MSNEEIEILTNRFSAEIIREIKNSNDLLKVMKLVHEQVLKLQQLTKKRVEDTIKKDFLIIKERGLETIKEIFLNHLKLIEEPYNNVLNWLTDFFQSFSIEKTLSDDDWLFFIFNVQDLFRLTLYISYPREFLKNLELIEQETSFNFSNSKKKI